MIDKYTVFEALHEVEDPEMKISVIDLALICDVKIENTHAEIEMSLTSPRCPVVPELMAAVHRAALKTQGLESVHVNLTFTPLWDPKIHATEDGKFELGIF